MEERTSNIEGWNYQSLMGMTQMNGYERRRNIFFYRMSEEEKVEATVLSLEEEAFMWYQFEDDRLPLTDWQEIKALILKYFRPGEDGDLFEQWMADEQRRSVVEYRKEFVTKLKHLGKVEKPLMLGTFLRGLKDEVRNELKVFGPLL